MDPIQRIIEHFLRLRRRFVKHRKVVTVLAAVVVFMTAYALTLPAITLDRDMANQQAGIDVSQAENTLNEGSLSDTVQNENEGSQAEEPSETVVSADGNNGASVEGDAVMEGTVGSTTAAISGETNGETGASAGSAADNSAQTSEEKTDVALSDAVKKGETSEAKADDETKAAAGQEASDSPKLEASGLPAGVELQSAQIDKDDAAEAEAYQRHYDATLAKLKQEDANVGSLSGAYFFDVSFAGADGTTAQPGADADLTLTFKEPLRVGEGSAVRVVRFDAGADVTAQNAQVLDEADVEPNVVGGQTSKVSFKASQPGVYGVVVTNEVPATVDASLEEKGAPKQQETENAGKEADDTSATNEPAEQHTLTAENDAYKVTLTYTDGAQLPEGAHLRIANVVTTSDAYAQARAAVLAAKQAEDVSFNEDSLGLAAVDISVIDASGNEIEPNAEVQVKVEAKNLPQEAGESGVEVHHIVQATNTTEPATEDGMVAQTVATDIQPEGTTATAEFSVDGFSVFTITWTTKVGEQEGIRFANVKVHYVDENGLEVADPSTVPTSNLGDGTGSIADNIVDLSTWAYTTDASGKVTSTSRVDGYTFKGARLGTLTGTSITGLKAEKGDVSGSSATYKLYYTADSSVGADSCWTQYKDATSGTASNNADVYLVFEKAEELVKPLTIHFIDRKGNALADANGKTTVTVDADAWGDGSWRNMPGLGNSINGYIQDGDSGSSGGADGHAIIVAKDGSTIPYGSPTSGDMGTYPATYGTITGDSFRYIRYQTVDGVKKFQVGDGAAPSNLSSPTSGSPNRWKTVASSVDFDIYVIYKPADMLSVTIHHVDTDGNTVNADTTTSVSNNGSISLSNAATVAGYTASSISYCYSSPTSTGTSFTTLTYAKGDTAWTSSADSTATPNLVTEVWVVYTPDVSTTVNVHHLNEQGAEVHSVTTKKISSGDELTTSSLAETISNFAVSSGYFVKDGSNTDFNSLTYSYNQTDGTWSSEYKVTADDADSTSTGGLVSDVYLVYKVVDLGNVTFHHVDTEGVRLADDQPVSMGNNGSNYVNRWNGSSSGLSSNRKSGIGTYIKTYVGYFGKEAYSNEYDDNGTTRQYNGLSYKYDGTSWHTRTTNNATTDGGKEYHPENDATAPIFLTDIYQVYGGTKGIRVHYVDTNGNKIADDTYSTVTSGNSVTPTVLGTSSVREMYAMDSAHMGSPNGTTFDSLTYTYNNSAQSWNTSYTQGTTTSTADSVVNDVYLVYNTSSVAKVITGHYVNQGDDGIYRATDTADATFTITTDTTNKTGTGMGEGGNPQYVLMGDGVNTASNKDFFGTTANPKAVHSSDGSTSLSYVTTRVGSEDGPELSWVKLGADGQLYYLSGNSPSGDGNASTTIQLSRQGGRDVWTYSSNSRTYTLSKDASGNFSLNDSLTGRFDLNLTSTDANGVGTYTATYRGENQVTQYSVTLNSVGSANETNYNLTVEDWLPSDSTDIYFIYRDTSDGLYIDNDLIYSGRLKVAYSDDVTSRSLSSYTGSDRIRNATYTWYKVTTTDTSATVESIKTCVADGSLSGTEVIRSQSGTDWNIAYEQAQRTWLDVAADGGARTTGTKVFYYVTMSYDNDTEGAVRQTLTSDPVEIEYYGQLENGSFETPDILDTNGNQINGFNGNQTSNGSYKSYGGVWQTTARTTNTNQLGLTKDIEIFNVMQGNTGLANYWRNGRLTTNTNAKDTPVAKDGDQFAELNADGAGALYQDVITHANEELSYWLSHRARISNNDSYKSQDFYDSMYLVIMPTKIAMTAGDNGGELDTQSELEDFIAKHGGFDGSTVSAEESRVTYPEDSSGIFIRKISSDNYDWHTIQGYKEYLATSTMTRFFFVAASTSNRNVATIRSGVDDKTEGNFLDDVGFSQELPTPEGFNLTVTKTFSGLTSTQIASLASNAKNVEGQDLSDGKTDHFTITLDNKHVNSSTGREDSNAENTALNGAVLEFTASGSGGSYTFTPTATAADCTTSLFIGQSSGSSRVNADGSVTLTWTFANQTIDNSSADQQFNYTAEETGETVSGLTINTTKTVTPADAFNKEAVAITPGADGTIAFGNSYSRHRDNDQPQITVSKTFSGVTPTTVSSIWSGGYSLTVTNSAGVTAQLSAYDDQLSANATLVSTTENEDGSMTYVWSISGTGWGAGTYTVAESNFLTNENKLTKVTVNDDDATPSDGVNTVSKVGVSVADGSPGDILSYSNDTNVVQNETLGDKLTYTLPTSTNIIIAKFETGSSETRYLVWTSSPLGRKTSNAVVDKIKSQFSDDDVTIDDVYFRSGNNPGTITSGGATLSYDSGTRSLVFTNTTDTDTPSNNRTWQSFYSSHYNVQDDTDAYDVQDIRVANSYNPVVRIAKVDSKDSTKVLSGAKFRIYKKDATGNKLYYLTTSTVTDAKFAAVDVNETSNTADTRVGSDTSRASEVKALSLTTGSDGLIEVGSLPIDSSSGSAVDTIYYLEEYEAPGGYHRNSDIAFRVSADGSIDLVGPNDGQGNPTYSEAVDPATVTWNDPYYTITVSDNQGIVLPMTGGMGTMVFALVGAALMAGAGMAAYALRRRRQGRVA